jgi:hypothetical protein
MPVKSAAAIIWINQENIQTKKQKKDVCLKLGVAPDVGFENQGNRV